jgi:putative endonuclease
MQSKFYVYILKSTYDKKLYVGFTTNLKERLRQHARSEVFSTKRRRFLQLIHYEYFINKDDAKAREVFLKSGWGHEQLQKFLKHTLRH